MLPPPLPLTRILSPQQAELAKAEELLEQQLELDQALLEGQEGVVGPGSGAQDPKAEKTDEEALREPGSRHPSFPRMPPAPSIPGNTAHRPPQEPQDQKHPSLSQARESRRDLHKGQAIGR